MAVAQLHLLCPLMLLSAAAVSLVAIFLMIVKLLHRPQCPPLFVAVAARLPPPDGLSYLWLIVKLLHWPRCPPLFVAVAAQRPPIALPLPSLSRRR